MLDNMVCWTFLRNSGTRPDNRLLPGEWDIACAVFKHNNRKWYDWQKDASEKHEVGTAVILINDTQNETIKADIWEADLSTGYPTHMIGTVGNVCVKTEQFIREKDVRKSCVQVYRNIRKNTIVFRQEQQVARIRRADELLHELYDDTERDDGKMGRLITDKEELAEYCSELKGSELAYYYADCKIEDQEAGGQYADLLNIIHNEIRKRSR